MKKTRNAISIDMLLRLYQLDYNSLIGLAKFLLSIADTRKKAEKGRKDERSHESESDEKESETDD